MFHVCYLTHYKSDSRDDTHQGERSRENNGGLEQNTSRMAGDSELRLPVPSLSSVPQQHNIVQVYKKQASVFTKKHKHFLACPCWNSPQAPKAIYWEQLVKWPSAFLCGYDAVKTTFHFKIVDHQQVKIVQCLCPFHCKHIWTLANVAMITPQTMTSVNSPISGA